MESFAERPGVETVEGDMRSGIKGTHASSECHAQARRRVHGDGDADHGRPPQEFDVGVLSGEIEACDFMATRAQGCCGRGQA